MLNLRKMMAFAVLGVTAALAGCGGDNLPKNARHHVPISPDTLAMISSKGMTKSSPIMLRSYKKESELEVWKQGKDGRYALLKTYPMCRWSGQLGPKNREGDRQVPEGFYTINRSQLNPNSSYYLSFNIGYPNPVDRSYGRSGAAIMVHGACTSAGCMSMTDEQIADIYALMREALDGGQASVQLQSLPFRMTAENLVRYRADKNIAFWRNLKEGADHFDVTKTPPRVAACNRRYVFNADSASNFSASAACPPYTVDSEIANAVAQKNHQDMVRVAGLIRGGHQAVKRVYADGDQHASFRGATISDRNGKVSRLDALARGASDVPVESSAQAKADAQFLAFANQQPAAAPIVAPVENVESDAVDVTGAAAAPAQSKPPKKLPLPMPTSAPLDLTASQPTGASGYAPIE
jgi:murein L,D-transpeptidase YafK